MLSSPVHADHRGSFTEWYKSSKLHDLTGETFTPVQANLSISQAGVVRGIHYSLAPGGQSKLVTVIRGRILDVVVDIRPDSPTFGRFCTIDLVAGSGQAIFLRSDLGHAFQALEDDTAVAYLVSSEYSPNQEKEISILCPTLGISLSSDTPVILSPKDQDAPDLETQLRRGLLPRQ